MIQEYLDVIQEFKTRQRAEVFVRYQHMKFIVGVLKDRDRTIYINGGGAVEKHETPEEAGIREVMEELGVIVKDMRLVDRAEDYSRRESIFFVGEFDRYDKTIYNKDRDALKVAVVSKKELMDNFKKYGGVYPRAKINEDEKWIRVKILERI